jgi:nucleotide-binding universal stress UspA family protein
MFHNILVAVDGSPDAEQALTEAIDLAEGEHTPLTLITAVSQLPATAYMTAGEALRRLVEDAHADAEAILRRARERVPDDLPVTAVLTERPIRAALIDQIAKGEHDLVVMGSRGRGAVRAALLGSVSHYVLHHSPVPVLIVRAKRDFPRSRRSPGDPGRHRHRRILLAAQGGLGGRFRGRRLVHGLGAGRPDPAGDR